MGRKVNREEARRNRTIRLSVYEENRLAEDAKKVNMKESEYVRMLILHGGVDTECITDRQRLIRQISGISNNINQTVKLANSNSYIGRSSVDLLQGYLQQIKELLKELIVIWR